ncbi:hypothetical protein JHK85_003958 [Glycine max]|nr:hypothetical protein JHK85_003958 [Glycine max]KAG5079723.1 hypothetical protein JHK86_003788 [Glycine max]
MEIHASGLSPIKNGTCTVRSAYYMMMKKFVDYDELIVEGDWKLLWNIDVSPRVKLFLWRLCRNMLPSWVKLRTRGVSCPITCSLCNIDVETTSHIFASCHVNAGC